MACSGTAAIRILAISVGVTATPGVADTPGAVGTRGAVAIPGAAATRGVATTRRAKSAPGRNSRDRTVRRQTWHALCAFAFCAALGTFEVCAGAPESLPEARPMYFEHLTMRDGLSQS